MNLDVRYLELFVAIGLLVCVLAVVLTDRYPPRTPRF